MNLQHTGVSGAVYYKHHWSSFFSNRFQLTYLDIAGTDASSEVYKIRNLTFQTSIYEVSNMLEFNFQPFGTNYNDEAFTPYFFTGIAGFIFDPRRLENEDIKLRQLKTEGQRRSYSRLQPAIPIGIGIKTISTPKKNRGAWIFGIEACWRKTFTDYLDDVKGEYPDYTTMVNDKGLAAAQYSHAQTLQGGTPMPAGTMRGDTHLKDWYYFVGISISYRITPLICRL